MVNNTIIIPLDKIEQNENSRVIYKTDELSELMASMRQNGLLQPVGVRKLPGGLYDAVFGNRRIMAAKKLGWDKIQAIIVEAETDVDRDILNLIENIKRKNTLLSEDGRMFKLLLDRGLTRGEVAARLDITPERVGTALDVIAHVPAEFHKAIPNTGAKHSKGQISATTTHRLISLKKTHRLDKEQTRSIFNYAKRGITKEELNKLVPLVKMGMSIDEAVKVAGFVRSVQVNVLVDGEEADKIEKKYGMSIRQFLTEELVGYSQLKSIEPVTRITSPKDARAAA